MSLALLNTSFCNLNSVINALNYCGIEHEVIDTAKQIKDFSKLILPGVGSFKHAMEYLNNNGFTEAITEHSSIKQRPLLGICLGMQLLSEFSQEGGGAIGMGLISGKVNRLNDNFQTYKVPNIGWCRVDISVDKLIFKNILSQTSFYHIHSYYFVPKEASDICATIDFAGEKVCVGIHRDNIYGLQFHPEKSHASGLQILKNFNEL